MDKVDGIADGWDEGPREEEEEDDDDDEEEEDWDGFPTGAGKLSILDFVAGFALAGCVIFSGPVGGSLSTANRLRPAIRSTGSTQQRKTENVTDGRRGVDSMFSFGTSTLSPLDTLAICLRFSRLTQRPQSATGGRLRF